MNVLAPEGIELNKKRKVLERLKVRLADKPEFKNARIRTRSGYYAPYKPTSQK